MHTRRTFVRAAAGAALGALAAPRFSAAALSRAELDGVAGTRAPHQLAGDEAYWEVVQRAYTQDPGFINLESGFFSPAADPVLDAQLENIRRINRMPSFYMRRLMDQERRDLKEMFGRFAGVSPDEFTFVRNTTEALNVVLQGIPLERGQEVLYGSREYPSMQEALQQRALRYGTVNRVVELPWLPASQDEVVRAYADAITPRTRYILLSHMIFLTGQVLPVRAVADMAHARGIEVVVDAAHSFAHLDWKVPELGADYLGSSLHKWLGCPLGTGLLYVKKEHVAKVWPLFGDAHARGDDIEKFHHIGTHPQGTDQAIRDAVRFHDAIGGARKEARLRYLKNRWVQEVKDVGGIHMNTPLGDDQSCAIANVLVDGMTPAALVDALWDRHRIFTVAVEQGARIAPNVFTRLGDLDLLVRALKEVAGA
ncbi:MAG TPA: aminotransferase class V-fold PLP-dependent enzyme [Longimicrobiales bacterium]|nr:aminotransferase class V-fold PLP-dependent enzyme [Longimicrobiales bacterium]